MSSALGSYSLWVMPQGPLADRLHGEIRQLAARVPGAPIFPPHVTLLGGIRCSRDDVLSRAAALAKQLKPYRISFDRVATGARFHQCVFVLCKRDADTMQAAAATRAALPGLAPSGAYMPHLSLLYSDISEEDRNSIAAEEQQRLFQVQPQQDAVLQDVDLGFDVLSLTVWETEEDDRSLQSWRQLAEYCLEG